MFKIHEASDKQEKIKYELKNVLHLDSLEGFN